MIVIVELAGEPIGKGRPRMRVIQTKGGAFPSVYTDAKTRNYEAALAILARATMRAKKPLEGPLAAKIIASFSIPTSWPRRRRDAALAGTIRPIGKPDWDNIGKISCDALNGIVFTDDSQIVEATVIKIYAERPSLRIEIRPIENFFSVAVDSAKNGDNRAAHVSTTL